MCENCGDENQYQISFESTSVFTKIALRFFLLGNNLFDGKNRKEPKGGCRLKII